MIFSAAIENMNNIFSCSVKSTYVAFLTLTLVTTNHCNSPFISVRWYSQRFFSKSRSHTQSIFLHWTPQPRTTVVTIISPSPLALAARILPISAFINRLPSAPVMLPSALLPSLQSAPSLIVRCWLQRFSSVKLFLLPIRLIFLSVILWPPLLRIFL